MSLSGDNTKHNRNGIAVILPSLCLINSSMVIFNITIAVILPSLCLINSSMVIFNITYIAAHNGSSTHTVYLSKSAQT